MSTAAAILATTIPGEHVRIAVNKDTEPFWQAAKERRLVAPQCAECQTFRLPPTPFCPNCQSKEVNWVELSGVATVYSFAVVHGFPGMPDLLLVSAVLDLPDAPGARLVSNVVDVAPADVSIGLSLRVDFSPIADGWLLPIFRVAQTD
ncbi:Zn-ribbon domain-containing OB-fold protein [Mycobacterium intracellulare]|uniref:Zn-ribbon domain-containing OB-fold protein n=1 Tax=Mycobacterium intracellulare TaxID=1767 RepID=UPI001EEEBF97|nr:zinc ribbon domain-containing protein [Mycobacterium intracellulare]MEE3753057.1 zinc ribbon domain-containing protein [Mycobacterium intracellulare]